MRCKYNLKADLPSGPVDVSSTLNCNWPLTCSVGRRRHSEKLTGWTLDTQTAGLLSPRSQHGGFSEHVTLYTSNVNQMLIKMTVIFAEAGACFINIHSVCVCVYVCVYVCELIFLCISVTYPGIFSISR